MRRFFVFVRMPIVWLTFIFFASGGLCWLEIPPPSRFVLHTGAVHQTEEGSSTWASLLDVTDNGGQVTIGVHHRKGRPFKSPTTTRLEVWDTRSGANETPPLWAE